MPGHHHDTSAVGLDQSGVVGSLQPVGVRGVEGRAAETLRGLHRAQRRTVGSGHDGAVAVDLLDRVDDGQPGHHRVGAVEHRVDDGIEQRRRGERPGGIVHQHDLDVRRERAQTCGDGVGALGAAVDEQNISHHVAEHAGELSPMTGRHHDHDLAHAADGPHRAQRVHDQRLAADLDQRLRDARSEAGAHARGDDNDAHGNSVGVVHVCCVTQDARTSSSVASAVSSLVCSASANSDTRIWRALASIRFSPADKPRS